MDHAGSRPPGALRDLWHAGDRDSLCCHTHFSSAHCPQEAAHVARKPHAWLAAFWFIGFLLMGGLLLNNLPSVCLRDPTLPYLLAGIGYPLLVIVTTLFAVRFLRSCEVSSAEFDSSFLHNI
jgi:hypothetical protein